MVVFSRLISLFFCSRRFSNQTKGRAVVSYDMSFLDEVLKLLSCLEFSLRQTWQAFGLICCNWILCKMCSCSLSVRCPISSLSYKNELGYIAKEGKQTGK